MYLIPVALSIQESSISQVYIGSTAGFWGVEDDACEEVELITEEETTLEVCEEVTSGFEGSAEVILEDVLLDEVDDCVLEGLEETTCDELFKEEI